MRTDWRGLMCDPHLQSQLWQLIYVASLRWPASRSSMLFSLGQLCDREQLYLQCLHRRWPCAKSTLFQCHTILEMPAAISCHSVVFWRCIRMLESFAVNFDTNQSSPWLWHRQSLAFSLISHSSRSISSKLKDMWAALSQPAQRNTRFDGRSFYLFCRELLQQ